MTLTTGFPRSERHAQLVWFDHGSTTGVCALAIRPRWLEGGGEASWSGLGKAVTSLWLGQVGREAKVVDDDGRARRAHSGRVVSRPGNHGSRAASERLPVTLAEEIETIKQCEAVLDIWQDAAWGYESFTPRLNVPTGEDYLSPVRIYSALRFVEITYGERRRIPFVQTASMAKTTATDERLKMAGLYQPGMQHATDAARHAATFLRRCRSDAQLRHMVWPRLFRAPAVAPERSA